MGAEEVGGVRHSDNGQLAGDLAGGHRCTVATDRLDHGRPDTAVDDPVGLVVPLVDVDVSNDPRG